MSFDLAVWYPQEQIGNKEAGELYVRLCEGDTSGVMPHPAIVAFYADLTASHPEIDTVPEEKVDDHDYCPWSCKLDYSPGRVIMSCVWPKATYVGRLVEDLARKHGLAVYDPQSDKVTYPDGSTGAKANTSHAFSMDTGSLRDAFCRDIHLLGADCAVESPAGVLLLRWVMCPHSRGLLSAGLEVMPPQRY